MLAVRHSRLTLPHALLLVMVVLWAVLPLGDAAAATFTVKMPAGDKYVPATLTVPVGTTIRWVNTDTEGHTATSTTHLFNSGNIAPGQAFRFTFTHSGTFHYYCTYHVQVGMVGKIIVR